MKGNFEYYNPTKIYFGKGSICHLKEELKKVGKRILLVYGMGSIHRNGIYDQVISVLKECDKDVFELSGVKSNPSYSSVLEGKKKVEEEKIDFILAVGEVASSIVQKRLRRLPLKMTRGESIMNVRKS